MKLKNKLEVEETLEVGVLPNAPTNNFSVVFETVGMFQRRQVGNIINKNDTDFLPSISNSFPTSVFAFNVSTTNANPNLTVSFVNQVAGTVFAAPQSLNGTPAFRMLQDSDLSQTSLGSKANANGNNLTNIQDWQSNLNVLTTNTNQTGLSGNKTTSGVWTFNSQINTANHGNSSQWKQAYDWGDFRDYGLGNNISSTIGNWDLTTDYSGFISASGHGISGWSTGRAWGFKTAYGNGTYGTAVSMRNGRIAFKTLENTIDSGWIEIVHDNNLDSKTSALGFIKSSALPTVNNGALTLTTGTGLSGSANFTANQAGSSTFSVAVASTHKLPTVAEWNALPTTNTTYTGSNGIDLVGTDFRLSASTLASLALANTAVQPSTLNNYYQSGDVNIPALGSSYRVFPYAGNTANFNWNDTTDPGFYMSTFNAGAASTYNAPKSGFYGYAENMHHSTTGNLTQYAHPYRVTDGKWMRSRFSGTWSDWVEFIHSGNLASYANTLLTGFVPTARTITINGTTFDLSQDRTWTIPDNDTITRLRGTTSGTYTSGDLTLLEGTGIGIAQSGSNFTITNLAPNVQADWNATSGLAQILNKPTIPDVIGNGSFTVQGTGSLTGSGSTSANASANTSASLDLTNNAKNDIQKGVNANDYVQAQFEYLDWERFHDASGGGVTIDVNESFNNIVCNTSGGGSPIDITNHNVNGAKLYLQGANHGTQQYVLDYIEKDGSFNTVFQVESETGVFTWSKELGVWRYLGTML